MQIAELADPQIAPHGTHCPSPAVVHSPQQVQAGSWAVFSSANQVAAVDQHPLD